MKRALLLDLDGTLADSLHILRECYERCALTYSREPSDAEFDAINGPPLPEIARRLSERWDLGDRTPRLLATYEGLIDDAYRQVDPMHGALELITIARSRRWTTGVVTSNSGLRTRGWLQRAMLADVIEVVVTHEDVRHGKPAPDAYMLALRLAGAKPAISMAVEDSLQGVAAARGAGLTTLALDRASNMRWPPGVRAVRNLHDVASFLEAESFPTEIL